MTKRPKNPITMEGMIWNANHVLTAVLHPNTLAFPRSLFERDLKGVVLLTTVEAGFIFTGNVGSGILLAHRNGKWSPPCAVGLSGVGWGFMLGASLKDVIVFLFDEASVNAAAGTAGLKISGQAELTFGLNQAIGRNAELALNISNEGVGSTVAISFTKGVFAGISLKGALVGPRNRVNKDFYKNSYSPLQILFEDVVSLPEGSLMPEIYAKLDSLIAGVPVEPTPEELAKVESALTEAERLGEVASKAEDVVQIDAVVEAEKEKASSPL